MRYTRSMQVTLTARAEELLREALARNPGRSPEEILEQALAERAGSVGEQFLPRFERLGKAVCPGTRQRVGPQPV